MSAAAASGGGYSGKTQALLREGIKERDKGKNIAPPTYPDGEDGARLSLNTMTFVERAALEEPEAVTRLVLGAAPTASALPDLSPASGIRGNDLEGILAAIHAHQSAIARDMVQREAGREAMRRALLADETVPWRVEQLQEAFKLERSEQLHHLKSTLASFREGVKKYEDLFAAEAKRAAKALAVKRDKAAAAAKFSQITGTGGSGKTTDH